MHCQPDSLVQVELSAFHLYLLNDFRLAWKISRDLVFGAANHEWLDMGAQESQPLGIIVSFDRVAKHSIEHGSITEQTIHKKVELGPELTDVVLYGRARQAKPVAAIETNNGLSSFALMVLDSLSFVQNNAIPLDRGQLRKIPDDQGIGADDNIALLSPLESGCPIRSMEGENIQLRRPSSCLSDPIRDDAGGA